MFHPVITEMVKISVTIQLPIQVISKVVYVSDANRAGRYPDGYSHDKDSALVAALVNSNFPKGK